MYRLGVRILSGNNVIQRSGHINWGTWIALINKRLSGRDVATFEKEWGKEGKRWKGWPRGWWRGTSVHGKISRGVVGAYLLGMLLLGSKRSKLEERARERKLHGSIQ